MRVGRETVMRRLAVIFALILTLLAVGVSRTSSASAATNLGNAALDWAESHTLGLPYSYGASGPEAYDCSGLVMAAYSHIGIDLPHSTYVMLSDPSAYHLHWIPLDEVYQDHLRGVLLFFGSGHVEMSTIWPGVSFGAHDSGSTIGWIHWWPGSWQPTEAFEVY